MAPTRLDDPPRSRSVLRAAYQVLTEQRTGMLCAFASAALLAVGTWVMDRSPELYRGLRMEDLRFFARAWRWQSLWLYAAAVTLAIWGTSAVLCTVRSVASLVRKRARHPSLYGAPLLHLTFVLALLAHLWGGLGTSDRQYVVSSAGTDIGGTRYRALRVDEQRHPNGMPRSVTATLSREDGPRAERVEIGYNRPLISRAGRSLLLLTDYQEVADGIVVRHRGQEIVLRPGERVEAAGDLLGWLRWHDPAKNPALRVAVVELAVGADNKVLAQGPEGDGTTAFLRLHESPRVLVTERHNPSVPLALGVALLLVLGIGLVVWNRVR
jgi:hypothetical protein